MTMSEKQPDGNSGIEITKFVKPGQNAVLTKLAYVNDAEKIKIDGSGCRMSTGNAYRLLVPSAHALAAAINSLGSNEAIAIGALKEESPMELASSLSAGCLSLSAPTSSPARKIS